MDFLSDLFGGGPPCPAGYKDETMKLLDELIRIGKTDDYLSEHPGGGFNVQCRHIRTRLIGKRYHEIGGRPLMEWAHRKIKRKLKGQLASHLEYAWDEVGEWRA